MKFLPALFLTMLCGCSAAVKSPCDTNNGGCDSSTSICTDNGGTAFCRCKAGFVAGGTANMTCVTDFSGKYIGSITEDYTCANSSPPSFRLSNDEITITQSGSIATISLASCGSQTFDGAVAGDTIDLTPRQLFMCGQRDAAGDMISVTAISGSITLNGGALSVNLTEEAAINGAACSGAASGSYAPGTAPDPCAVNNGGCDPNATCTNVQGSAACICNNGFTGNGSVCAHDLAGTYQGPVTESYTCSASNPLSLTTNDQVTIKQTGASATVSFSFCSQQTFMGSVSGFTVTIPPSTASCSRQDAAGDMIDISQLGGTLTLGDGSLQVNLSLQAQIAEPPAIGADGCMGTATGTLP